MYLVYNIFISSNVLSLPPSTSAPLCLLLLFTPSLCSSHSEYQALLLYVVNLSEC